MMGIFRNLNKNKNPYFIVITRYIGNHLSNDIQVKIVYIGNVSKEEMPYGMARGVSSNGDLVYSYKSYRTSLLFRESVQVIIDSQIPKERVKALPDDTVIAYDLTKFKKRYNMSDYEKKMFSMYKNGEVEWISEIEERNKKIDSILN